MLNIHNRSLVLNDPLSKRLRADEADESSSSGFHTFSRIGYPSRIAFYRLEGEGGWRFCRIHMYTNRLKVYHN